jgi:hypothetical protein
VGGYTPCGCGAPAQNGSAAGDGVYGVKRLKSTQVRRRDSWLQTGVGSHDHRKRK